MTDTQNSYFFVTNCNGFAMGSRRFAAESSQSQTGTQLIKMTLHKVREVLES